MQAWRLTVDWSVLYVGDSCILFNSTLYMYFRNKSNTIDGYEVHAQ